MPSKEAVADLRVAMRRTSFLYDDGVVLCMTLRALDELGLVDRSLEGAPSVLELMPELSPSGFGYLRVALRTLAGQGWLGGSASLDPATTVLNWTESGRAIARDRDPYLKGGRFLASFGDPAPDVWSRPWRGRRLAAFSELVDDLEHSRNPHLEAALAVPTLLRLQSSGALLERGPELPDDEFGVSAEQLFRTLDWTDDELGWTPMGLHARNYAPHFGIVGSYLPLFSRLPELFRGEITVAAGADAPAADSYEWHVNRQLNVIASAAAHRRYFADADEIFIGLFDREPVSEQPRFVADMGCGDGSWLVHLYRLISERTRRGRHLESDPLLMVGIDFNAAALEPARMRLEEAGVPGLLLFGDVSDPDALQRSLAEHGLSMQDGLHVRSFLDHDRLYHGGNPETPVPGSSTGAYVDRQGHALSAEEVERDLVEHLRRWTPHVRRHGMVVLEAHTVPPRIARQHLGALHSVAFDTYHGYSHQYPIEHSAYVRCCREANFERVSHCERHYPSRRPFVAVSLNRLLPSAETDSILAGGKSTVRRDTWSPKEGMDLDDGRGLHELLFEAGDIRYPRIWCSAPTGYVVRGALNRIEERLETGAPGDVIRVLDYGTGTGLAAIELLKAVRERRLDSELERRGVELEVHLADLPSGWFAQGYELLKRCPWTRFHSLRSDDGEFRPLQDVTGGLLMDAVMANMVFHLIPPDALDRLALNLLSVIPPGGQLVWSSPDLAPAQDFTVLFHDPNRALRARWKQLLAETRAWAGDGNHPTVASHALRKALTDAAELGKSELQEAQARADRRILPEPQQAEVVERTLSKHLRGAIERKSYEMLDEEILDALLVPSNQGEFLSEIEDPELRAEVVRALMMDQVLPELGQGQAGTGCGLNIQWTLGTFSRV